MTPEHENPLRRIVEVANTDPELTLLADALSVAPASAAELARASGLPADKVRKHLRKMKEDGLIESVRTEEHRGTVEHFYSLTGEMIMDAEELEDLSFDDRRRMRSYILKLAVAEAIAGLVTRPTERGLKRVENPVVRYPMIVDEEGWSELVEIHTESFWRLKKAKERIDARLAAAEDPERFRVTSLVMLFESPVE